MIDLHQFTEEKAPKPLEKHSKLKLFLTLLFIFLVVFLGVVAGFFVYLNTDLKHKFPIPGLAFEEELIDGTEVKKNVKKIITVSYSDGEFSPNPVYIKIGTTVRFLNTGSDNMRVASNPHPQHSGLLGFDQKGVARSRESYEYLFTRPGRWDYHNHILPQATGTIIVRE